MKYLKNVPDILVLVLDELAAIVPVSLLADCDWEPEKETPILYGFFLLCGIALAFGCLAIFITLCGFLMWLLIIFWKLTFIILALFVLCFVVGKLRLRNCKDDSLK